MKNSRTLLLALAFAATGAAAQVPAGDATVTNGKPETAKAADARKSPAPKKAKAADAKKAADARKAQGPKKAQAPRKPAPPKKPAPATSPATGDPNVRIYKAGDPRIPRILGNDGKPIPTNPDAYDVSSATKK